MQWNFRRLKLQQLRIMEGIQWAAFEWHKLNHVINYCLVLMDANQSAIRPHPRNLKLRCAVPVEESVPLRSVPPVVGARFELLMRPIERSVPPGRTTASRHVRNSGALTAFSRNMSDSRSVAAARRSGSYTSMRSTKFCRRTEALCAEWRCTLLVEAHAHLRWWHTQTLHTAS